MTCPVRNITFANAELEDAELLLRRYDPTNSNHFSVDQKTGEPVARSGCLRWDREPVDKAQPADFYGISVTRDAVLRDRRFPRRNLLQPPNYTGLLGITAEQVRRSSTEKTAARAVADPLPVTGSTDTHNEAHALIRVGGNPSGRQRDRVASNVARHMRPIHDLDT